MEENNTNVTTTSAPPQAQGPTDGKDELPDLDARLFLARRLIEALLTPKVFGYGIFLISENNVLFSSNGVRKHEASVLRRLADAAEAKLKASDGGAAAATVILDEAAAMNAKVTP